jgi:hypothetical protein
LFVVADESPSGREIRYRTPSVSADNSSDVTPISKTPPTFVDARTVLLLKTSSSVNTAPVPTPTKDPAPPATTMPESISRRLNRGSLIRRSHLR